MDTRALYRPRDAAASPLYRVVLDHVESFAAERPKDAPSGPFAEPALRAFLECGIPCFGVARFRCAKCGASRFVPFSCKRRMACPSCDAKRAVVESGRALEELLPQVAYRQWVLVLPKRLRWFVNSDARLAGEVARILGETLTRRSTERSRAPENAAPAQLHALSASARRSTCTSTSTPWCRTGRSRSIMDGCASSRRRSLRRKSSPS